MGLLSSKVQDYKYADYPQEWHNYRNSLKQYVERKGPWESVNRDFLKGLEDMTLEEAQQAAEEYRAYQRDLQLRRELEENKFVLWFQLGDDPLGDEPTPERFKSWMEEHKRKFGLCPSERFQDDLWVLSYLYHKACDSERRDTA